MTAATATTKFTCTQANCACASKCGAASFCMSCRSFFAGLMMGDIAVAVSLFVLLLCAMVIFVAVPVAMMILASAIAIILGLWGPDSAKRRTHAMRKLP